MFLGHFALAMAAKRVAPKASLGILVLSAQFADLLWPFLLLLGLEQVRIAPGITRVTPLDFVSYPISHSLLMQLVWGLLLGTIYFSWRRDFRTTAVVGVLLPTHWLLDYFSHRPDMPLYPGGPKVGLGMWNSLPLTLVAEFGLFSAGLILYLKATRSKGGWNAGFWSLAVFLAVVYLASLFGSPPPSVRVLAFSALALWLTIPWAAWGDRQREPNYKNRSRTRLSDLEGDVKKTVLIAACVLGAVLALAGNRFAEADDVNGKVDALVQSELQRQHIPGAAVGVYRDGKLTRAQGYGLANVEWDAAVTPDTIFQSGSVGKQFTATAVMMLVEEGKVSLDDPIKKYFPDAPESWNDIKVHNLLSHTSGLSEYETGARTKVGGPFYMRMDYTENELYKRITEMPMDFKTGEDWSYRNTNYVLLGILIHKVTGQFYGDFLQERIFRPLGMSRTRIISEADIIPRRSAGYQLVKGELKNQDWVSPSLNSTADGALYFTVEDLQKWDAALYTEKLLRKASLDRMWTVEKLNSGKPNKANYGFAWEINSVNGHRVIEHGGAWQGFTTYIARYVDDRLTVVALTNLDSGHSNPKKITSGVAALYNPALKVVEAKPIEDKEPQVKQLVSELMREIADGKAKPEQFTEELQKKLFPDEMQELGPALKEFGELKTLELMERTEEGERRNYRYRAKFPNLTLMISVGLTKDNKIAGLNFSEE